MEVLKNWISGICSVSIMIAILKAIIPEGHVGKTFNITASLLLVIVVIAPFKQIDFAEFKIETEQYQTLLSEKIEKVNEESVKLTDDIIEEKIIEYICSKTGENPSEISVSCKNGEVVQVILYKKNDEIKNLLKTDLGIPEERIIVQGA